MIVGSDKLSTPTPTPQRSPDDRPWRDTHANGDEGLVSLVKRMMDGVEHLVSAHLELVRLELKQDARSLVTQVAKVAMFMPLVLTGMIVLFAGLGLWLGTAIGAWQGFMIVGGGTLLLAGVGLAFAVRSLRTPKVLDESGAQAKQTRHELTAAVVENGAASGEARHAPL